MFCEKPQHNKKFTFKGWFSSKYLERRRRMRAFRTDESVFLLFFSDKNCISSEGTELAASRFRGVELHDVGDIRAALMKNEWNRLHQYGSICACEDAVWCRRPVICVQSWEQTTFYRPTHCRGAEVDRLHEAQTAQCVILVTWVTVDDKVIQ